MEKALIVVARNGVPGLPEIEYDHMVFEHDRSGSFAQKPLQRPGKGIGIHVQILVNRPLQVCDG